jgi:hypothetical protein
VVTVSFLPHLNNVTTVTFYQVTVVHLLAAQNVGMNAQKLSVVRYVAMVLISILCMNVMTEI